MFRNNNRIISSSFAVSKRCIQSSIKPEVTELSNGISVVSRYNPNAATSTFGYVFGSGSADENPYNNGVSKINQDLFTRYNKDTNTLANKNGLLLDSVLKRDYQSFLATSLNKDVKKNLSLLNEAFAKNTQVNENVFNSTKSEITNFLEHFENDAVFQKKRVLEHLHSTAYQNTPYSLPKFGTAESINDLILSDVQNFNQSHFKNSNVVIVNDGNVKHEDFVNAVESEKISFGAGEKPQQVVKSSFLGSEVRLRDDTLPKAWISIAVEGESTKSENFLTAQVAAQIFGKYVASEPTSSLQGIKLLDAVHEYHLCDDFKHFSLSYNDSGLWGFRTATSNFGNIDDLIHFTLKQWNRLTISITETELTRAKQLLKLKLAAKAEKNIPKSISRIGNSVLTNTLRPTLTEEFAAIDAITVNDIKEWAGKRLWDQDIAIAGTGQIEGLLDYMRIRNDMSMMRW
ncbi:hypothetical protein Kpol_1013p73 [Vanderwaltozyma polyspora DSM 70294]|uniref:Peptidase M16 C-terminal domain-containing protein n=1 Tax=Vanderwaltozyma polyspora (strain ATCC 22028 / DSM 70294 / BCRC 21397 / CBS 2163 / NBRC 10782 / NRRL Y-8283 / UCD 57-17) TaxID=436907 RepID=A7THB7_VANPO|nr:uncharacterized protein Kpol_1013p73 [Vanderwaltozyma polyspora DSM 70294]EDO18398.1 hypothetical protein Kpol_1013p73 [Vanderwaltozyma polyspora DSM 70294]